MSAEQTFRMTEQRRIVLEEIRKVYTHPTAREVFDMVKRRAPRISLGTVYRALDLLCLREMVQKLPTRGGSENRFDGNPDAHYHVTCVRCNRVDDLALPARKGLDKSAAKHTDYHLTGHRLDFQGVCPKCQKKKKRKRRS